MNYLKRIALSNPTHMMSMVDLVAIGVETPRIDSGCSLEKENQYEPLNDIISNCQSSCFMSQLCLWSLDLIHQKHFVDR